MNYLLDNSLKCFSGINIPSADTILLGDVELSESCQYIGISKGKTNRINVNVRMNGFLVDSAIEFNQFVSGK